MDNLQTIDAKMLPQGRVTDRLIAEYVYKQNVVVDTSGELRVAGECGHDPTPGETDVRELAIVPQYSRDAMLAEEAFVVAVRRAGLEKAAFTDCEPGSIFGDQAWTLRDSATHKKIISAPTKALMYCKAAILMLQRISDECDAQTEGESAEAPAGLPAPATA